MLRFDVFTYVFIQRIREIQDLNVRIIECLISQFTETLVHLSKKIHSNENKEENMSILTFKMMLETNYPAKIGDIVIREIT